MCVLLKYIYQYYIYERRKNLLTVRLFVANKTISDRVTFYADQTCIKNILMKKMLFNKQRTKNKLNDIEKLKL